MTLSRTLRYLIRRFTRVIMQRHDSSRQIAGGAALGMLVAFTPTMGLQMAIAAVLSTLWRLSRLPAILMVYVTNPFTAIPIYGFCYMIGVRLLRPFHFRPLDFQRVRELFVKPEDLGFWETIYHKLGELFGLGWAGFVPLWLGCLVVGIVAAALTYWLTLRFVTGHRLLKAERAARRAQRRLERIRLFQSTEHDVTKGGGA